jgi:hypothetical protein
MPLPTFSIASDPSAVAASIQRRVPFIIKNIRSQVFSWDYFIYWPLSPADAIFRY